jgi:hypothetical protein
MRGLPLATHDDAIGFRAAQCEPGEADLHQQRFGTERPGSDHFHRFARDKAEFPQPARNGVVGEVIVDAFDGGGDAARQVGQPHGRGSSKCELFSRIAPTARL